jgi:Cu-Zn family superoxide dismutase
MRAGDHFNPDGLQHGFVMRDGLSKAHAGDLGNIEVGPDGTGRIEIIVPGLTLGSGQYSVGGRSLVVHEKEDSFGQPAGNAGGRFACGPIMIMSEQDWKGSGA